MAKKGWVRESARHALAARGLKTSSPQHPERKIVFKPWSTDQFEHWEDEMTFIEEYEELRKMPKTKERDKLMLDLLHRITIAQDYIQLGLSRRNNSILHVGNLTNHTNAIMLALSRSGGNMDVAVGDAYLNEKINSLIRGLRDATHDYNLMTEPDDRLPIPKLVWDKEEIGPIDDAERKKYRDYFHKEGSS
jgi:hypothetical protein